MVGAAPEAVRSIPLDRSEGTEDDPNAPKIDRADGGPAHAHHRRGDHRRPGIRRNVDRPDHPACRRAPRGPSGHAVHAVRRKPRALQGQPGRLGHRHLGCRSQAFMAFQSDGNLVVYINSYALWNSGTAGNPGARLVITDDGNISSSAPPADGCGRPAPATPRHLHPTRTRAPTRPTATTEDRQLRAKRPASRHPGSGPEAAASRADWQGSLTRHPQWPVRSRRAGARTP